MSVFTSPYNSPQAQHRRLLGVAQEYRSNTEALKTAGLFLGIVGAAFLLVGWAIFSLLGLCMLGAALAAYRFFSVYDSPCKPASFLLGVAEEYRVSAQTLKTAGLWLGGVGAAFVIIGSGIWSFLGLCMLGAALAAHHIPSVHYDSRCKPPCFKCPYCSQQMVLFQEWICGHCETWNEPRTRTFVERCIHCDLEPHSLLCSVCGRVVIFFEYNYNLSPEESSLF